MSSLQDVDRDKGSDRYLAAKRGAVPHLAVATEQGTVYIWDTSKRDELGRGQFIPAHAHERDCHDYARQTRRGSITISTKTVYSIFSGPTTTLHWQLAPETTLPASQTLPPAKHCIFYADTQAP